jgi:hypothetical protein
METNVPRVGLNGFKPSVLAGAATPVNVWVMVSARAGTAKSMRMAAKTESAYDAKRASRKAVNHDLVSMVQIPPLYVAP